MATQPTKEKDNEAAVEERESSCVSEDQKSRAYYYDDAHGYEDFDPDEAEEENESDGT